MKEEQGKIHDPSDKWVVGLSRYLRWGLGLGFFIFGMKTLNEGGWAAILIGTVLIVTGFLKPQRCLNEKTGSGQPPHQD